MLKNAFTQPCCGLLATILLALTCVTCVTSLAGMALLPTPAHAAQNTPTAKKPPAGTPVIVLTVKKGGSVECKASGAAAGTPVWVESAPEKFTQHSVGTDMEKGLLNGTSRGKTIKIYGAITHFDCTSRGQYAGDITALDVRNNTALQELNCRDNKLTSLILRNDVKLKELVYAGNPLTEADIQRR